MTRREIHEMLFLTPRESRRWDSAGITPGILKSIHKKHRLYKESLSKITVDAIYKYKAYKNKLTKIIKLSQHKYYVDRFENFMKAEIHQISLKLISNGSL